MSDDKNLGAQSATEVVSAGSIDSGAATARHTPAPWTVQSLEFIVDQRGCTIAHVWEDDLDHDDDPEDERDANAHLIAAAPELLDLLKSARHGLASASDSTDEWRSQCVPLLHAIDIAIAKAEGR